MRQQLQMALDHEHKDLIRQLAKIEGLSMTRYLVRLVLADRDRRLPQTPKGDPARSPSTSHPGESENANEVYTEAQRKAIGCPRPGSD